MRTFDFSRNALGIGIAAAFLAGCGGSQPPIAPLQSLPFAQAHTTEAQRDDGNSWMAPEAKRIKELLYVSDQNTNRVYIYSYKTGRVVGKLVSLFQPSGQCIDRNGDIWIADYVGEAVVEYPHGDVHRIKRIRTDGLPNSCTVDPTTGNLAVANAVTRHGPSNIVVFTQLGEHSVYSNKDCNLIEQVGYDNHGNLYVAAGSLGSSPYVCELPHGGKSLEKITISRQIRTPRGVMWDGKYIAFTDDDYLHGNAAIYQATPTRSGGLKVVSTTVFKSGCGGLSYLFQPFIVGSVNTPSNSQQGTAVVGDDYVSIYHCEHPFSYWVYPAGGKPTHNLFNAPLSPSGQSVSIGT